MMTGEKTIDNSKAFFESPKAEVILFHTEDVITTSLGNGEGEIKLPKINF